MVKISLRLTDVARGRQVWAESYTHPLEASLLIATHEAVARQVVAAVASEYGIIARRLSIESRKKRPADLDTYEAMLRYYSHQTDPSPESGLTCLEALRRAVDREPEYGPAWSALATLHCQMYSMDVQGFEHPLETGLRYARRGVDLEPGSQLGRLILAYASYLAEDDDAFREESATALALNPNSPYTVGTVGYFHAMRGDYDQGLPLVDRAIALNPYHPRWFHAAYCLRSIQHRDYDRALADLERHAPFLSFYLPAAYTVVLAKLGRIADARGFADELVRQKPEFPARARDLVRRAVKIEQVVEDVVDGLRLAGLSVGNG